MGLKINEAQLNIVVDKEFKKELERYCIDKDQTIKTVVVNAIEKFIKGKK